MPTAIPASPSRFSSPCTNNTLHTADAQALRPAVIARYTACRAGAGSYRRAAVLRTVPLVDGAMTSRGTSERLRAPRDVGPMTSGARPPQHGHCPPQARMVGASSGPSTFPGTIGTFARLQLGRPHCQAVMAKYRRCSAGADGARRARRACRRTHRFARQEATPSRTAGRATRVLRHGRALHDPHPQRHARLAVPRPTSRAMVASPFGGSGPRDEPTGHAGHLSHVSPGVIAVRSV